MKSALPKPLHRMLGRPILGHVLHAVEGLGADHVSVVVGVGRDQVVAALDGTGAVPVVQDQQGGTGHATRLALEALPGFDGTVLVLTGDTPLLTGETLADLVAAHRESRALATVLTAHAPDPTGYGRIIRDTTGAVIRIVEQRDADRAERAVTEINTGVFAFAAGPLRTALTRLSADNAQGEEYLTDVVKQHADGGSPVAASVAGYDETAGINDRVQLAAATAVLRGRILQRWMREGVTVIDPASTWVDVGVTLARDVEIRPGVQLQGVTTVGEGAVVGPDCTLTDTEVGAGARVVRTHADRAVVGAGASVGPFAYLRPGAVLAQGAKVGTYVEVKGARIGEGSKVPHLSYVGNATIGAGVNIGAGTIFVNYDGVAKHESSVDDQARTGAHNSFVAPVHVGAGAYTGAGAVITGDVPPGALAVSHGATQRTIEGWTARKRAGTPSAAAAEQASAAAAAQAVPAQASAAAQAVPAPAQSPSRTPADRPAESDPTSTPEPTA